MSQSLSIAHARGWNLAAALMVCITVFHAGNGDGVMPSAEYDGDPATIMNSIPSGPEGASVAPSGGRNST